MTALPVPEIYVVSVGARNAYHVELATLDLAEAVEFCDQVVRGDGNYVEIAVHWGARVGHWERQLVYAGDDRRWSQWHWGEPGGNSTHAQEPDVASVSRAERLLVAAERLMDLAQEAGKSGNGGSGPSGG